MTVLSGARVLRPEGTLEQGWVEVGDGAIRAVGEHSPPAGETVRLAGGYLVPGFIDMHCHGGAGTDFATGGAAEVAVALDFHLRHGCTGLLASLGAAPLAVLGEQAGLLARIAASGAPTLLGCHAEGPFLSARRCGAQNPAHLRDPDLAATRALMDAAGGFLAMMTIAPELPGALDVIAVLRADGVLAAIGHTDATYDQAMAGFEAGATVATHLFNGMRPMHHRDPGPVLAALNSGATCEVINDGVHVDAALLRLVADRDPAQLMLITDATSASGMGDGEYHLGGQAVTVAGGQARLAGGGSLAGSTITMDAAVRHAVVATGLSVAVAVAAASTNPARLLGLSGERGAIRPGLRADLVHLDDDLRVVRVMQGGAWVQ